MKKQINKNNATDMNEVAKILEEIRKWKDLRKFQSQMSKKYMKKYSIKQGQVDFLISVVAAERIKEKELL